jgi:hypothetical protein
MTHTLVVSLSVLCALSAAGCVTATTTEPATPPTSEPAPTETPAPSEPAPTETPAPVEPGPSDPTPGAGAACTSDADCVPASCCHASACVAKGSAPSCENTMCTKECRGGTLDCGGHCLCQNGTCVAELNKM